MDNRKPIDNAKAGFLPSSDQLFSCAKSHHIPPVLKEALDALKTPWLGLVHTSFPFCDHYRIDAHFPSNCRVERIHLRQIL